MASDLDIIIVGAGAAGIAAGLQLLNRGYSFLIFEASARVGGRGWTRLLRHMPLDLGCGWLHSADRNAWTRLAERLGFAIDRTPPAWETQFQDLGFPKDEQEEAESAYQAFERRLRESPPASDRASDALEPSQPWNAFIEARSGYANGVGTDQLSVADYRAYEAADTGVNWRLPAGYGALLTASAASLPVRLSMRVECIDRRGSLLRLQTERGTASTRAVIVAVPTSVLSSGQLHFDPPLPGKTEAAARLPLGTADKLFLALDGADELAADCHLLGNPHRAETGSYYLRPFGRPIVEAFFGGACAAALEQRAASMADFALDELAALFGSDFRRRLRPIAASAWSAEPFIAGAYSHALPGHAPARDSLRETVEERIFFAGEACSTTDFSTAHGAFDTGAKAAEAAIRALSRTAGEAPASASGV